MSEIQQNQNNLNQKLIIKELPKKTFKYIDISKTNTEETDKECRINNYIDGSFDLNEFSNISLVKMDLNLSELRLFRVILKQPQQFIEGKQDKGYYETIYKIKLTFYNANNELKEYEVPIYFYNHELDYKDFNIQKVQELPNQPVAKDDFYYVDNFNKYFSVFSMENFNLNVNRSIQEAALNYGLIQDSGNNLIKVLPTFDTINNTTYFYIALNNAVLNNDGSGERNSLVYYNTREEVLNDKKAGAYCIGFNYYLNTIYYKPFMTIKQNDFYYLNNSPVKSNLERIELITNSKSEIYYIQTLENSQYTEYISDIQSLIITTSIKTNTIYANVRNTKYILYDNDEKLTNSGLNVFTRLNIDHTTEKTTRIIYSNSNITNNSMSLLNNTEIQSILIEIYIIDKFGNNEYLTLHLLDTAYIQIAMF